MSEHSAAQYDFAVPAGSVTVNGITSTVYKRYGELLKIGMDFDLDDSIAYGGVANMLGVAVFCLFW